MKSHLQSLEDRPADRAQRNAGRCCAQTTADWSNVAESSDGEVTISLRDTKDPIMCGLKVQEKTQSKWVENQTVGRNPREGVSSLSVPADKGWGCGGAQPRGGSLFEKWRTHSYMLMGMTREKRTVLGRAVATGAKPPDSENGRGWAWRHHGVTRPCTAFLLHPEKQKNTPT